MEFRKLSDTATSTIPRTDDRKAEDQSLPARWIQLDLSLAQVIGGSLAALYTQSLHRTRTHAQAAAALIAARRKGTDERPAAVGPPARAVLRPRRLIAAVLIVFGLAVAAITGFELLSGHPLSGGTAGTTLGELTGNGSAADSGGGQPGPADQQPSLDPDPAGGSKAPTTQPTEPSPSAPSTEPGSPTPTPPSDPAPSPTPPAGSDAPR